MFPKSSQAYHFVWRSFIYGRPTIQPSVVDIGNTWMGTIHRNVVVSVSGMEVTPCILFTATSVASLQARMRCFTLFVIGSMLRTSASWGEGFSEGTNITCTSYVSGFQNIHLTAAWRNYRCRIVMDETGEVPTARIRRILRFTLWVISNSLNQHQLTAAICQLTRGCFVSSPFEVGLEKV